MRALLYSCDEAVASLWRGRRSNALSVVTIAVALVVLGTLLLVGWNVERWLARWASVAQMSVYLLDYVTPEARASVEQTLRESPLVAQQEFLSSEEALIRFRRSFADLDRVLEFAETNPFPASVEVRLAPDRRDPEALERLAAVLESASGVAGVRLEDNRIERATAAVGFVRGVGLALVLVLVVAAALTVASVVRFACFARRDEVEIMKLVGAPLTYVRGPFVLEGVLQGGIGAAVALAVLSIGFVVGDTLYGETASRVLGADAVLVLPPALALLLLVGGMGVGCVGGFLAARGTRHETVQ